MSLSISSSIFAVGCGDPLAEADALEPGSEWEAEEDEAYDDEPAPADAAVETSGDAGDTATSTDAATSKAQSGSSTTTQKPASSTGAPTTSATQTAAASSGPPASGPCSVPSEAALEDVSKPTTVVGTGTPASCTSAAFVDAVAKGGVITFNCGPKPVTITLDKTAKVVNRSRKVVIDGGGKVTLSGGNKVRILYQNTCDSNQIFTTSHCDNQDHPQLTVQNLTFADGNARGEKEGGGAIYAQGGRLKVINSRFVNNVCHEKGEHIGGGAIRSFQQHDNKPIYIVGSAFGGQDGRGNTCSSGGALSSIGVSYTVINSAFSYNKATGNASAGGGSGGAIYNDGNTYTLDICGTKIENNSANAGGGAIFYVSNNRGGTLTIKDSALRNNKSGDFQNYPGMYIEARGEPTFTRSVIE